MKSASRNRHGNNLDARRSRTPEFLDKNNNKLKVHKPIDHAVWRLFDYFAIGGGDAWRIRLAVVFTLAVLSFARSWDGDFVFDDAETIVNNADVQAHNTWTQVFLHDYWATHIRSNQSHKSYRPLTTLTFRLVSFCKCFLVFVCFSFFYEFSRFVS